MSFLRTLSILLLLLPGPSFSQSLEDVDVDDDDLNVGGDIFNDFNEDVEASRVMEDERFYRYGRYFSFLVALGLTTFDGNRGTVYENDPPTYGMGIQYFLNFNTSFGMGFEFSKHHMFFGQRTFGFQDAAGFVDVSMLRFHFGFRHYIDTSNLGTAITYSNPYFTGRMEYWYVQNKFRDKKDLPDDSGGGLGLAIGGGLEFPIELKESYIGVELLYHTVNFHDKFTQNYRPPKDNPSAGGIDDLTGNVYTTMVSYVISW